MWLGHHCFIPLVKEVWNSQSLEGWEGFKLIEKLKLIKEKLKGWNKIFFGDIRIRKGETLQEIDSLDRLEVESSVSDSQCARRQTLRNNLDEVFHKEEICLEQKSSF